jgi:hypothetical protein
VIECVAVRRARIVAHVLLEFLPLLRIEAVDLLLRRLIRLVLAALLAAVLLSALAALAALLLSGHL